MSGKSLQFSPFTGNVFEKTGRSLASQGLDLPDKKAFSPEMSAWIRGEDLDLDSKGAKMVTPYAQSSWVYIAVSILANQIAQIPFRFSRLDSAKARRVRMLRTSADTGHKRFVKKSLLDAIIDSGPVVDLFNRPHKTMNRQLFMEMVVTWNALRGEFFILPLDSADQPVDLAERSPRVQGMLTVPPELFWHIVMGYELTAWRYTGSPLLTPIPSEILLPSEVIHSRDPNPYLYWRGMSPLFLAMNPAATDFAGAQFQKGLWINNADTGVIVTTDQQATEEQRSSILAALKERKRKAGTADRPLFLWGGAKVEKPTLSLMDMQFLETRNFLRKEIFSLFKVPDSIAGFSDDKSSSLSGGGGAITAEKLSFLENTIGSLCSKLEAAFAPIVQTFGDDLIGWFDLESLPAMQQARRDRIDAATKAFAIGASFNEINECYDLGFRPKPWGDKSYLPFNLQEVGGPPEPQPSEDDPKDNEADEKSNPFARLGRVLAAIAPARQIENPGVRKPDTKTVWESHMRLRKKTVKVFESKFRKVLNEYRGKTLARLATVHLEKTGAWITEMRDGQSQVVRKSLIDLIFSPHEFGQSLNNELQSPMQATLKIATDELLNEIGQSDPWEMPPKKVSEYLAARKQPIMGVGDTVRDQLNTSLVDGVEAGETTGQLADRVREVYNALSDGEATRVARTETNSAYNYSRHETMLGVGIEYKAWLSSHGPHVRPAHAAAEEYYIDAPIPVDEPFLVGGEDLMFPGDPAGSPGNIINCQCVQIAAQRKGEDEKSVTFLLLGVGEMTFSKKLYEKYLR